MSCCKLCGGNVKIIRGKRGKTGPIGPTGPPGETGPTGPTGGMTNEFDSIYVDNIYELTSEHNIIFHDQVDIINGEVDSLSVGGGINVDGNVTSNSNINGKQFISYINSGDSFTASYSFFNGDLNDVNRRWDLGLVNDSLQIVSYDDVGQNQDPFVRFNRSGPTGTIFYKPIYLPTSGGNPSPLDYYTYITNNVIFKWGSATAASMMYGVRLGKTITLASNQIAFSGHAETGIVENITPITELESFYPIVPYNFPIFTRFTPNTGSNLSLCNIGYGETGPSMTITSSDGSEISGTGYRIFELSTSYIGI